MSPPSQFVPRDLITERTHTAKLRPSGPSAIGDGGVDDVTPRGMTTLPLLITDSGGVQASRGPTGGRAPSLGPEDVRESGQRD